MNVKSEARKIIAAYTDVVGRTDLSDYESLDKVLGDFVYSSEQNAKVWGILESAREAFDLHRLDQADRLASAAVDEATRWLQQVDAVIAEVSKAYTRGPITWRQYEKLFKKMDWGSAAMAPTRQYWSWMEDIQWLEDAIEEINQEYEKEEEYWQEYGD
jgi:hypothetical protein